ncbi:hypothetical protein MLD38_035783 [Melastoma candidum]|uniref:Uncharacterized protein n=1 Tax=Melastoma candidum TaxID=119954 RepID=A0ACB9LHJ6_9MYRT|nr:hypothetical protein MLD38_035783 [Melastoma candidum]
MSPTSNQRPRPPLSAISSRGSSSIGPDSVFGGLIGGRKSWHSSVNALDHGLFDDIPGRSSSGFDSSSGGRRQSRTATLGLPAGDAPGLDVRCDEGGYDDVFVGKNVSGNRRFDDLLARFRRKDDKSKRREKIGPFTVAGYAGRDRSQERGETMVGSVFSPPFHRSTSSSGLSADLLEGVIMPEKYSGGKERSHLKSENSFWRPAPSTHEKVNFKPTRARVATSRLSTVNANVSDDVWLTVSEIPLLTQPTKGPPPSRPPPPLPAPVPRRKGEPFGLSKEEKKFSGSLDGNPVFSAVRARVSTSFDQIRSLSMGRSANDFEDLPHGFPMEEPRRNSDAVAMKTAMDTIGAKFHHVNESEGSEVARSSRSIGSYCLDKNDGSNDSPGQVVEEKERFEREWLWRRARAAEKERGDKEQRRLERENERAQQIERERQAVERVTREARARAAAEARLKAEKGAIEKDHAQNIERAERAAVQRALTEARLRAANEATEKAAKAAAEVRDREARGKSYEAWMGVKRATVERTAADAKGQDAADVRQMAMSSGTSSLKANSETSENVLDSTFKKSCQASSASRTRESSTSGQGPDMAKTSTSSFSRMRQAPLSATMADNLPSAFGVAPAGEFQEIEGETEERRIARMERHQRTQERAAKALAEKNLRDMQIQKEQEERVRIAETMDTEIKRWAAGKEGNLRALLSTLQYVLWPECRWQPVSLTDLINSASVRKAYRKATLCVHPDKVQQKGANLQQKYVAEKVFDLLKEAWNKLNSEVF